MKMYTEAPLLSIVVPTLNSAQYMPRFMQSLACQTFPASKTEILVLDGGSTDHTIQIAKQYGARVINNPDVLAEKAVTLGISKSRGGLIMILAVDNVYAHKKSIETIVRVFDNQDIYAAFPKHDSNKYDSLFTKYHNTFTDPFNHFIYGYSANARTFNRVYQTMYANALYDVYDYDSNKQSPMIAFAQGFTIRGIYRKKKGDEFDDILPVMTLIKQKKHIAYVYAVSIIHHTTRDMGHFIRKQRWATHNFLSKKKYGIAHRLPKLSGSQQFRMKIWPLYAFSIILPCIVALFGLIRDGEVIWLFHPIACFISAAASAYEVITYNSNSRLIVSRQ